MSEAFLFPCACLLVAFWGLTFWSWRASHLSLTSNRMPNVSNEALNIWLAASSCVSSPDESSGSGLRALGEAVQGWNPLAGSVGTCWGNDEIRAAASFPVKTSLKHFSPGELLSVETKLMGKGPPQWGGRCVPCWTREEAGAGLERRVGLAWSCQESRWAAGNRHAPPLPPEHSASFSFRVFFLLLLLF